MQAAAGAENSPPTVRGTMKYEPYVFAPPAPAPPSAPPQEGQYVTNPQLNSLASLTVNAVTGVEQEALRHDFDRELGLSDAVVSANFPPGQQRLAVFMGVLIDSTQAEYKARIMVTQKGFCITAADTRLGVHPYPYVFVYLPYNYIYSYVRCVAVHQDVPVPGTRFIPAPYPQAADSLRIYTSDCKMHIIRRVPVDQLIRSFDYLWRIAVHLVQPAAPVVYYPVSSPVVGGYFLAQPAPAAAQPVYLAAQPHQQPQKAQTLVQQEQSLSPPPGVYLVQEENHGIFSNVQTTGTVLRPSPCANFAVGVQQIPQQHQQHKHQQKQEAPPKPDWHSRHMAHKNGYTQIGGDQEATAFGRHTGEQGMVLSVPEDSDSDSDRDKEDEVEMQPVAATSKDSKLYPDL